MPTENKSADRGALVKNIERRRAAEREPNPYYLKVARGYRYAKYVAILLLAVFVVYVVIAYGSYITYDNLMYLIKDFNTESAGDGANFSYVKYDEQQNMSFTLYNGELAVLGSGGLALYSAGGSKTLEYFTSYSTPMLEMSDKYVLAYDMGGTGYSLYTSIARVVNRQADQVIMGSAVSDSGAYALITRSSTSKFKVSLYSPTLNLQANYYKDNYVADAAISPDGKNIVIASYSLSGYDYACEIMLCSSTESEPLATLNVNGACPYKVEYLEGGGFTVVCDTCIIFFDESGNILGRYYYSNSTLSAVATNGEYTVVALTENSVGNENTIVLLDREGKQVYSTKISKTVKDVSISSGHIVYVLSGDSVIRINPDLTTDTRGYTSNVKKIIAFDKYVLLCTPTHAEVLFTADGQKNN